MRGEFDQVPMCPKRRVLSEVGCMKEASVLITKDPERPGWKRVGADKLTDRRGFLRFCQGAHIEREASTLRLAAVYGKKRVSQHKAADDIRSAGNRLERDILHISLNPIKLAIVQDRTCGENGAK